MDSIEKVIKLYERVTELEKAIERIIYCSAKTCPNCPSCAEINSVACKVRKE